MNDPVFGPLIDARDVQRAVEATLDKWIETYLAMVERLNELDPRTLPAPESYVHKDDGTLDKRPEDQTPTIVILSPGTTGEARMEGDGMYRATWVVNVAAIVESADPGYVSELAKLYNAVIRAALVQNGSLDGFAVSTRWRGERNDDLRSEASRSLAAGTNVFEVTVKDVVQKGAGLRQPPENPYEVAEPSTVDDVEVELKPEEITP